MTCTIFSTDTRYVTDLGIRLSIKLNKLFDILWPFVTQKSLDKLEKELWQTGRKLYETKKNLVEFEEYHYSLTTPLLPFPENLYSYNFKVTDILERPVKRFTISLDSIKYNQEIDISYLDNGNYTEYVKASMIEHIGLLWKEKGEKELTRYLGGLENDNKQVRKVSKY